MVAATVTRESYCRAESDRAFSNALLLTGGVNRFFHFRQVTPASGGLRRHVAEWWAPLSMAVVGLRRRRVDVHIVRRAGGR